MANIHLTMATNDYDHVRDIHMGIVRPDGIDLTCLTMEVEEIFHRFLFSLEWDISEISTGMSTSWISRGNAPFVLIPVFPSRVFRHSSIYIHPEGRVKKPADLKGKRVGVPEWGQTAGIYTRGWMVHEAGVALKDVSWVQSGVNDPGRQEAATLDLPEGVRLEVVTDRSLTQMLLDGDLDAIFTARAPAEFLRGNPGVVRLFPDFRKEEEAYCRKTGIFPIMHSVAIRKGVADRHPWVPMNVFKAFDAAKKRSVARMMDVTASQIALPWLFDELPRLSKTLFGGNDYWPYGMEPNRVTLEAFLLYGYEQGVFHRHLKPEDLYPESVQHFHRK
jgi:4,5-dihydroxyphthalate decarboxylase